MVYFFHLICAVSFALIFNIIFSLCHTNSPILHIEFVPFFSTSFSFRFRVFFFTFSIRQSKYASNVCFLIQLHNYFFHFGPNVILFNNNLSAFAETKYDEKS